MADKPLPTISVEALLRRPVPTDSLHLNLRMHGLDAQALRYLQACHPNLTDSFLIRECNRISAYLFMRIETGKPVTLPDGCGVELLEYIGAFEPQRPMDTRKRKART